MDASDRLPSPVAGWAAAGIAFKPFVRRFTTEEFDSLRVRVVLPLKSLIL